MMRRSVWASFLFLVVAVPASAAGQSGLWTRLDAAEIAVLESRGLRSGANARRLATFRLDSSLLDRLLATAAFEGAAADLAVEIELPAPGGGGFERFAVFESPVMEPELADWLAAQGWPMRTYKGVSLERPATIVRLDWGGPAGFHAMIDAPEGDTFVDPAWRGDRDHYRSYAKLDDDPQASFRCLGEDLHGLDPDRAALRWVAGARAGLSTNGNLRTYRAAVAATGEYTTTLSDGTAAGAQADVATVINRVNMTYERELAVRLMLVGNNNLIIYTNAATDPYDNSNTAGMLDQNTTNLNAVIGSGNYDIGHVFGEGGSGIASLEGPCGANKARGVSRVWMATGDAIVLDMIAHEIGHQFGARHTFNSVQDSCGGNRSATTAWEPGGGTTIMSYSGSCGIDNVQGSSDDYFHGGSLDEMLNFIGGAGTFGSGACAALSNAGNDNAPVVQADGTSYTIPANTPFELRVLSSSDADGDSLTFNWEQFDLGAAATLAAGDLGDNPLVRSVPPASAADRDVLGGVLGEILPTMNRSLAFRVTARDNNAGGGRVGEDTLTLNTTAAAGPFVLTSPNGGENYPANSQQTVTWNVAGTNAPPVSASNVDILLSADGGATFPFVLASATPTTALRASPFPRRRRRRAPASRCEAGATFSSIPPTPTSRSAPSVNAALRPSLSCPVPRP
jgi:hypothetical protein